MRPRRKHTLATFSHGIFPVAAFAATAVCALTFAPSSAGAGPNKAAQPPTRTAENRIGKDPVKGPLQIIISVDQQRLHLYGGGEELAEVPIATGVADHPTPLGIFSVVQKSRDHRSNIYSNAPMPFMQRITWSGVALHEGVSLGHPASHGCVRMPHDFAVRLWGMTKLDARVVIARPEVRPLEIFDQRLFVHRDSDSRDALSPAAAPAAEKLLQTAASIEADQATDAPGRADQDAATPNEGEADPPQADDAEVIPLPPPKPAEIAHARSGPISVFISGKAKRIYVRQDFLPLFDAPVAIQEPEERLGTHVFTAMEYADDGSSFRWNVISMPGEARPAARRPSYGYRFGKFGLVRPGDAGAQDALTEGPREALDRIEIPRDALDLISELIVPGSSLIISDQGLGEETGEGTNFIVVTR